nr:ricin-type beta-trefoil lectin domain protein [Kibdelosporangium sp. MJ126-NF4]CEL13817.1 hypothetical protein [Kibdelosporangium sp. MJ126-NF4]CTQ88185.1 hypothetical protein [Kibdelosporangium sp. MJ126-NF4]
MKLKDNLTRLTGAVAAIAFGSTLLVGAASAAQAAAPVYYQVINGNSRNACLQVMDAQTGEGYLVLGVCDRSAKQVWTIINGVFRNPASGHCLDGNGAKVYTKPCNGGGYQQWTTTSDSPKSIKHEHSDKYLHGTGTVGSQVIFQRTIGEASRWVIDQV